MKRHSYEKKKTHNSLIRKQGTQLKKWARDLNSHSTKGDTWMADKHMKRYSTSLVIRQIQMKTTVRYH